MQSLINGTLANPAWHILKVRGGFERRARFSLGEIGTHGCFPEEDRLVPNGKGQKVKRKFACVPGYVFAKFNQRPVWREFRRRGIILGVICRETQFGPVPYEATENDVRRFMGIPTVEEEIEAARREAMRVRPGDRAKVLIGPDVELAVIVDDVQGKIVRWSQGGLKGQSDAARVEKLT